MFIEKNSEQRESIKETITIEYNPKPLDLKSYNVRKDSAEIVYPSLN
jgi:hypothetical protein